MTIPVLDVYGSNARPNYPLPCACTQAQTDTLSVPGAANTTASVTLAAKSDAKSENLAPVVGQAFWSYSAAQTGGRLTITDGGTTIFDQDLSGTQGSFAFTPPLTGTPGNALVANLYPGGAVTGKLKLNAWYQA